tara:strand:+ start:6002 stop:6883 length:882 start_codon:yes stop_codon:yes gene_type:complete
MLNDHKEIKNLVPVEISGLSKETDLSLEKKERSYKIIRDHINNNTKDILTPSERLKKDGYLFLGNILNSGKALEELSRFPIYKGHIKNDLYSDNIPIVNYNKDSLESGIYCWSMSDLVKCKTITDIATNPMILDIVSNYLGCLPTCYGINCMFSSGTSGHGTTRRHRDLDDFKFLSLFIYLDDVDETNGAHAYETGTHLGIKNKENGSLLSPVDRNPKIFTGKAGDAFLEDNWGIHYGLSLHPEKTRRCLWVRYGLYDNFTSRESVGLHNLNFSNHTFVSNDSMINYVFRFLI